MLRLPFRRPMPVLGKMAFKCFIQQLVIQCGKDFPLPSDLT